jgi:VanZ family protein
VKTLVIWLGIVLALSIYPFEGMRPAFAYSDKVVHFVLYSITCALIFTFLNVSRNQFVRRHALFISVVIASLYGLAMEMLQYFVKTRQFSLLDEASNVLGAIAAAAFIAVQRRRR